MGKNKSASGLTNFVQYDNQGNIFFVSGSNTLMSISSSGAITTTGVISGSNALSSSLALTASSIANLNQNVQVTGSLGVTSTITAQTLVVQTVTSSIVYSSGSNIFGNSLSNTQQMTGSVLVNGSVGIGTTSPTMPLFISGTGSLVTVGSAYGGTVGETRDLYLGNTVIVRGYNEDGGSNLGFRVQTWNSGPVQALNIKGNGNVGIKTTNPSQSLHVVGTTGLPFLSGTAQSGSLRLQVSGSGTVLDFGAEGPVTGKQWIQATNASDLSVTYPLLLNPNGGSVGIGTTSPSSSLHVVGTVYISGDDGSLYQRALTSGAAVYWDIRNSANVRRAYVGFGGTSSTLFDIANSDGGDTRFTSAGTERMRITSAGVLQLNTGGPGLLTLGASNSYGGISSGGGGATLYLNGATRGGSTTAASNAAALGLDGNFYIADGTTNTYKMTITSAGNMIIGNTSASNGALDVNANSSSSRPLLYLNQGGYSFIAGQDAYHGIILRGVPAAANDYSATATDYMSFVEYGSRFNFYKKQPGILEVQVKFDNGVIYAINTSVQSITSDVNLKTDIRDYDKGLAEVVAMKPRYFKYKKDLTKEHTGFIAQEMEEAVPGSMIDTVLEDDSVAKTYVMDWYPILVKAIQELKTELDAAKAEIEILKTK